MPRASESLGAVGLFMKTKFGLHHNPALESGIRDLEFAHEGGTLLAFVHAIQRDQLFMHTEGSPLLCSGR